MKFNPEDQPDCLTKKELARRWECSIKQIDFLIYDRSELRLAAKTSEIPITGLRKCEFPESGLWCGLSKIFGAFEEDNPETDFHSSHYPPLQNIRIPNEEIVQPSIKEDLPRFIYRVFSKDIQLDKQSFVGQDLQGLMYYLLTGWCSYDRESGSYYDPKYCSLSDRIFEYLALEEVERYERKSENALSEDGKPVLSSDVSGSISSGDEEIDLTKALPPRTTTAIAKMFPLNVDEQENIKIWKKCAENASRNGLIDARVLKKGGAGESTFDPWLVGEWLANTDKPHPHLTREVVNRRMASNLEPGYEDLKDTYLS